MKTFGLLVLIILPFATVGQTSKIGDWIGFTGNKKFENRWNWHHEIQYRNYNLLGDLEQILVRTGLGYNLADNHNLLLGYAFTLSENYHQDQTKAQVFEQRIFQQYSNNLSIGKIFLSNRYRIEERWFEEKFNLRLRYHISANLPLNNSKLEAKTFYLGLWNEIFVNAKMGNHFDRNRTYIGLGYMISNGLKIDFGYMNQFFSLSNRDQISLGINWNY